MEEVKHNLKSDLLNYDERVRKLEGKLDKYQKLKNDLDWYKKELINECAETLTDGKKMLKYAFVSSVPEIDYDLVIATLINNKIPIPDRIKKEIDYDAALQILKDMKLDVPMKMSTAYFRTSKKEAKE